MYRLLINNRTSWLKIKLKNEKKNIRILNEKTQKKKGELSRGERIVLDIHNTIANSYT